MEISRLFKALLILVVVGTLSGCASFNKGTMRYSRTTTIGQELVDLRAREANNPLDQIPETASGTDQG